MAPSPPRYPLLLPPLILALLVLRYAVDAPYHDDWVFAEPLLRLRATGEIAWNFILAPHNEHWIPLTKLLGLLAAHFTSFDARAMLPLAYLSALAIGAGTLAYARALEREQEVPFPTWLLVTLAVLLFSPSLWRVWLTTLACCIPQSVAGTLGAVLFLWHRGDRPSGFAAAAASAFLASISFASGVLAWFVGLVPLATLPTRDSKQRLQLTGLWLALGAGTTYLSRAGIQPSFVKSPFQVLLEQPLDLARYTVNFLGAPLAVFSGSAATILGTLGLVTAAYHLAGLRHAARPLWHRLSPALAMMLYALTCGVVTGVGRLPLGITQGRASRYLAFSNMFWVGLVLLVAHRLLAARPGDPGPSPRARKLHAGLAVLFGLTLAFSWIRGLRAFRHFHDELVLNRVVLLRLLDDPGASFTGEQGRVATELHTMLPTMAEQLAIFRRLGLSIARGEPREP